MDGQEQTPTPAPAADAVVTTSTVAQAASEQPPVNEPTPLPNPEQTIRKSIARLRQMGPPREAFVMAALTGLCSRSLIKPAEVAAEAVKIADAVIAELKAKQDPNADIDLD